MDATELMVEMALLMAGGDPEPIDDHRLQRLADVRLEVDTDSTMWRQEVLYDKAYVKTLAAHGNPVIRGQFADVRSEWQKKGWFGRFMLESADKIFRRVLKTIVRPRYRD